MDIHDAIRHALDGRAILFTGAGFSYGARNIRDAAIPSGKSLTKELLTEIGYPNPDGQLDKAAGAYLRRKSKRELVDLLVDRFTVKDVSGSHEILASIPWRRVYTTNYDTVFEEASRKNKKTFTCVEGIDTPREQLSNSNLIVHINGVISRITEEKLENSFKLVSQSYAADSFEHSGWAFHFRNDIRAASVVIFVGYSMYDLDVRRVLFSEDISEKCFFVIAPITPDNELDAEDLSDLGVIIPVGIDSFAADVSKIKADHIPAENELLLEKWEATIKVKNPMDLPSDGDVLDFLVAGDLRDSLLFESIGAGKGDYVIERAVLAELDTSLTQKDSCVVTIGELGTGKSFIYDCISQLYLTRGYLVYKLNCSAESEITEAEAICAMPGKKLLIIENYQRHMNLLRWLSESKPGDTAIALSARSNTHDLFANELNALFGSKLRIYDLSSFTSNETNNAIHIFDRYGLWGDRLNWPTQRKRGFITHDCHNFLPSLLVDILKSKHITERYRSLLSESQNRSEIEKLLVCAFTLEVIGFHPKIGYIEELLANRVHWASLRSQTELKSIVNFGTNSVHAKSSVLARHLLNNVFTAKQIVETLIGMAQEAESKCSEVDYYEIFNALVRYRNLSLVLPEEHRLPSTINFYEGIKNLPKTRRNPQFWLQYAIACLAFGKLDRAERYFDDAYSFAPPGYDKFKIDNHYARLLCEKALVATSSKTALPLIDEAKRIIFQQMSKELQHYPFRVALGLFQCYERFLSAWSPQESIYFMNIFQEIKKRCEATKGSLSNHRYVIDCLAKANEWIKTA